MRFIEDVLNSPAAPGRVQKKNVLVHRFVCRGTVEERVDEVIAGKQKLAGKILSV